MPCRTESPYLTSLQRKYEERGFTVVAVNGYDEPREKVAGFVEQNQLDHPILLAGSAVARKDYLVAAYPTNYLIGRDGRILFRNVGFEIEDVPELEATIEELLRGTPEGARER